MTICAAFHELVQQLVMASPLVDEIYLGLSFDEQFGQSCLEIDGNIVSINSFSKYFNMTGWRLAGWWFRKNWLPRLSVLQNLFICPSTAAQTRCAGVFEPESLRTMKNGATRFRRAVGTTFAASCKR